MNNTCNMTHIKYRVREVTMANGEVRFFPERTGTYSSTAGPSAIWVHVGPADKYCLTLEEARQHIDLYKRLNPVVTSEVIHNID